MNKRMSVYGTVHGQDEEQRLLALEINPTIQTDVFPAEKCIVEALERYGCTVTSIRKQEVLEHELLT